MSEWPILPSEPIVQQLRAVIRTGGRGARLTGPTGSGRGSLLRLLASTRSAVLLRAGAAVDVALAELADLPIERPALLCVEEMNARTDAELNSIDSTAPGRGLDLVGSTGSAGATALRSRRRWLRELAVLPVPPLSDDEAAELCRVRLGVPLDVLTLRRLLDPSDGLPLHLRDIVTTNLRGGALHRRNGFWCAMRSPCPSGSTAPRVRC